MAVFGEIPVLAGFVLAWGLAAPPGPANALIAHVSMHRGWRAGWVTGMGAIAGDVAMFGMMHFGVIRVVEAFPVLRVVLGAAGSLLLVYFAWEAVRAARSEPVHVSSAGGFARNFVTVVTSPFNWAWWLTAGTALFDDFGWWNVAGFFAGLVAWVVFWSRLAREGARRFTRFREVVAYGSAAVLLLFAARVAFETAAEAAALL